jgi:SAM-dependent methyltransferase
LLEIRDDPGSFGRRINRVNFANFRRYRSSRFLCPVCGSGSKPLYDFPDVDLRREHRIGILRETLQCRACFAPMRERSLAVALLDYLNGRLHANLRSVEDLAQHGLGGIRLLNTDAFSKMSALMRDTEGVTRCSYIPGQPWGKELAVNYYNVDLQRMSFPDASFDVLLTSDVMEHVRDCDAAHREIFRVLKPGGAYIFNVPYVESSASNIRLVDTSGEKDVFLCEPHIHGDPLTGGILAYRIFGRELFQDLAGIGFNVEFRRLELPDRLVLDGDVFIAHKPEQAT